MKNLWSGCCASVLSLFKCIELTTIDSPINSNDDLFSGAFSDRTPLSNISNNNSTVVTPLAPPAADSEAELILHSSERCYIASTYVVDFL